LGEQAPRFKEIYEVTAAGNWEGHTILNRLEHLERLDEATETELAANRIRLLSVRSKRVRPGLDDKVLADWNGLMIAALASAAPVFDAPDWLGLAEQAFAFVGREMTGQDGRLRHSWRAGCAANPATLDDYANLSRAALLLHESTGKPEYLAQARAWIEIVDRYYADSAGGYFVAASDTEGLLTRPKMVQDSATPSGNGTMIEVLARLYYLTGAGSYRASAEAAVKAFAGDVPKNFFPFGSLLNGNETLQRAVQVVIRGQRGEPGTVALLRAVHAVSLPTRVLTVVEPGAALPAGHPAEGKDQADGRATAYICRGPVCSLPITDAETLRLDLDPSTRASGARSG
jgi:uncharacterized protein YyaL (SSP411 family)